MSDQDEYLIGLDAFAPKAGKRFTLQGHTYAVRHFNDVPVEDVLLMLRAEQDLPGQGLAEQLELNLRYVAILVPEMDRAALAGLSANQLQRIRDEAMELAEVPLHGRRRLRLGYQFALAARFYGWSWGGIRRLTLRQLEQFLALIPEIRAQERLEEAAVALSPHVSGAGRREILRSWLEAAERDALPAEPRDHEWAWDSLRGMVRGHA